MNKLMINPSIKITIKTMYKSNKYKNNGLNFFRNTMYMRTIPLIKVYNFRKKIHIAHYCTPNFIYMCILPHACWKSPERVWTLIVKFALAKSSFGAHTIYSFSFCLRIPLEVSFQALTISGIIKFGSPEIALNVMFHCSFRQCNQPSEAVKFSELSVLADVLAFSWIMAPGNGMYWLCIFESYLRSAASNAYWTSARSFWGFTFCPSFSDDKCLSLFLTHEDIVFFLYTTFCCCVFVWQSSLNILAFFFYSFVPKSWSCLKHKCTLVWKQWIITLKIRNGTFKFL